MEELQDAELYRLDRYVMLGGRVLFALEGLKIDARTDLKAGLLEPAKASSLCSLIKLVSWYGATVQPALVCDVTGLDISVQEQNGTSKVYRYPPWFGVEAAAGNVKQPITAGFEGLDLFWASPLKLNPPQGVTATPLFKSTAQAWLQTKNFSLEPDDDEAMEAEKGSTTGTYVLGAALSGSFPSFFKDPVLPAKSKQSRIVVLGDCDIGSSFISFAQDARDLHFMVDAADWLCSDDDIIAIRSRARGPGRLDKIKNEAQKEAAQRWAYVLNMFIIPVLVLLLGGGLWYLRRRTLKREEWHEQK
jgi:ABC-type uncharacterized transport system involved in gliding motility auxiliary subunit